MADERRGKDLFIVDNGVSGWTGLRYLEEWTGIAKSFDIATGYFEIGSLLALDGKWQQLDKLRILMGAETTFRTRKALLSAVTETATARLDESIEGDKEANPFLTGVPAILEAMKSKKIEVRVYDKNKFHAKAYITHAKLEVVGAQALVGSSNFTKPGLTQNIELNIQVQSAREVAQLQEWFEVHWNEATEVTPSVIQTIERHTQLYTPFDVYAKSLQEFFRGHELTASEWDETRSKMFARLDRYQKEAYWALMKIAKQHGGAFLCDGVGLGKTFVGLMLIERLVVHENKRVVLFAPKSAKESVWEPHLKNYLSQVGGSEASSDFSSLAVFSHTDLSRTGAFPERFRRIAELADVIIIDEAHHFRNPGSPHDEEEGNAPSRYHRLFEMLNASARPKMVFMLTATPINNRLSDFRHMAEIFTQRDEAYFAKTVGINNLTAHFNNMEKALRRAVGDSADASEHIAEASSLLGSDEIFQQLVVQRSRAYARASQEREKGSAAVFPDRSSPNVASYSIRKTYGRLLESFEKAFKREKPLFSLPMYYPLFWYHGKDTEITPFDENRQKQVVGLIRVQFLKRFESSVTAFELSCDRLMRKLLAFLEVHCETPSQKKLLGRWKDQHAEVVSSQRKLDYWSDLSDEDMDEDVDLDEFTAGVEKLDKADYKVDEMIAETFLDLDQIATFLEEARRFEPKNDDKLQKLIRLLKSKDLADEKVLIFTEFADTARYLSRQLKDAGIKGVAQIDSGTKVDRAEVLRRFSPYYNDSSADELAKEGESEIRVLIATDVLSEGLNLQDATKLINYDIHWNPVRLMQRIGRVDRRLNPAIEARLTKEHPERKASRGKVLYWNFLPPDELNEILTLYKTVTNKALLISKTFGIEGRKLLTPDDDFDALKEFNQAYEGTKSVVEDMHLEYQALLQADPSLESRLVHLPRAVFSGRAKPAKGTTGVFFCYALPALDKEQGEFTEEAGPTRWYMYDVAKDAILEEPGEIVNTIRSKPETPRKVGMDQKTLVDMRQRVEKHVKDTYLKRVDAPIGVKATLKCWMEINGGS